jgi:hypothetical protein
VILIQIAFIASILDDKQKQKEAEIQTAADQPYECAEFNSFIRTERRGTQLDETDEISRRGDEAGGIEEEDASIDFSKVQDANMSFKHLFSSAVTSPAESPKIGLVNNTSRLKSSRAAHAGSSSGLTSERDDELSEVKEEGEKMNSCKRTAWRFCGVLAASVCYRSRVLACFLAPT